jgi:adhesin transport system membrane fusion protein
MTDPTKPNPKPPANRSVNNAGDWAKIQGDWSRKFETAQARADRFFMTDEELPLHTHMLLIIICAFIFIFIIWANFATLDEVTKGQGKVIPTSEIQVISSLEGGIVDKFMVTEGQDVKIGQPLLQLRDIQAASDLGSNRDKYFALKARMERLQAEVDGKSSPNFTADVMTGAPQTVSEELQAFRTDQTNVMSQQQVLDQEVSQRRDEIAEARGKASDLQGVLSLAKQQRDMTAPMVERGSAPKMELLTMDRDIKEKETELNSAESSIPAAVAAMNEAQARIRELSTSAKQQAQTDLSTTMVELDAIAPTLSALKDRMTRTELKSPVNGTVKDMKIKTVGGVAQPGQAILEIVPSDDQLLVEANVRPADIAFIYPGEPAVVKLTAYDYSIYGGLKGKVVDISADSITNEKGESFYRVKVRTDENHLTRKGQILKIIPGMVASVDIMTGKKTVMEYLLKPFVKTLQSSMRER